MAAHTAPSVPPDDPYGAHAAFLNPPVPYEPPAPLPWCYRHPVLTAIAAGLAVYALGIAFALAADEPKKVPEFVPFVVDQQQYAAVMGYLNGLAFKDAAPLVKWLNENEERAKGQWEADNRPKGAEVPK